MHTNSTFLLLLLLLWQQLLSGLHLQPLPYDSTSITNGCGGDLCYHGEEGVDGTDVEEVRR